MAVDGFIPQRRSHTTRERSRGGAVNGEKERRGSRGYAIAGARDSARGGGGAALLPLARRRCREQDCLLRPARDLSAARQAATHLSRKACRVVTRHRLADSPAAPDYDRTRTSQRRP